MSEANNPSIPISHEANQQRFQGKDGGTLNYELEKPNHLVITHVAVPEALRGRGIAAQLVEAALAHCKKHGLSVIPQCSYAAQYLKKRKAGSDLN